MHLQRQRYILFEFREELESSVLTDRKIDEKDFIRAIWSSLVHLFGEYYAYKSGLWMIRYDNNRKYGIIRCDNVTKERLISSLAFITDIKGVPIIIHVIKTSGTIKKILKVQREFFSIHRRENA